MVYYDIVHHFYFMIMRKLNLLILFFAFTILSGCELIGDIFAAGAYTGIIVVVIVIAVIIWLLTKLRGRR